MELTWPLRRSQGKEEILFVNERSYKALTSISPDPNSVGSGVRSSPNSVPSIDRTKCCTGCWRLACHFGKGNCLWIPPALRILVVSTNRIKPMSDTKSSQDDTRLSRESPDRSWSEKANKPCQQKLTTATVASAGSQSPFGIDIPNIICLRASHYTERNS